MHRKLSIGPLLALAFSGCASTYSFTSNPSGAAVYHKSEKERRYLGETPLDFSKSTLPDDAPFVVVLEKPGYEAREVSILPTNQARTSVRATLQPDLRQADDTGTRRAREVLKAVFAIQDAVGRKDYVDALGRLSVLEKENPALPEINVLRGSIYVLLGKPDEARAQWKKALERDPALEGVRARLAALPKPATGE